MTDVSLNPSGSGFHNWFTNGVVRQQFLVNDGVYGKLPLGTVVQVDAYPGPGTAPTTAVPTIQPSSTDSSVSVIGVVSAGTDLSGVPNVPPGKVATVTCVGITRILVDASTVAGEYLVQSPSTPGATQTSSSPSTTTLGVCLESVSVSTGTALAWAYIVIGGSGGGGGGGGVPTLNLTYNGNGPVPVQVLDGLSYNPTTGGYIFGILPAALNGFGEDVAAFLFVNGSATIEGFTFIAPPDGTEVNGTLLSYGPTGAETSNQIDGLFLQEAGGIPTPNPGNTPNGIPAIQGMVLFTTEGGAGGIWLCIQSYNPGPPTDAEWVLIESGGGSGAPTLSLSYNGNGPTTCQVLDGLTYDPSAGGYIFAILPGALTGIGFDLPAICNVDNTGTIQSFESPLPGDPGRYFSFGPTLDQVAFAPGGLVVGTTSTGNPGNVVSGINAQRGMVAVDTNNDGLWICVGAYDPIAPTNAIWNFISSLLLTVNSGPTALSGAVPLAITSQPLVNRPLPIIQPLPPMFGFEFSGTVNTAMPLNVDSVPEQIAAGPDRNLWVADSGSTSPGIWRIEPDGTTTLFPTTSGSTPTGLAWTTQGYWWLTDPARNSYWWSSGSIYGPNTPTEVSLAGVDSNASPGMATLGPDGNVWAIDTRTGTGSGVWQLTTNGSGLATIQYAFGGPSTQLTGICAGPDGNLWVSDASGFVWMVTTAGDVTSFAMPTGFLPASICTGADGRLWCLGNQTGTSALGVLAFTASNPAAASSYQRFGTGETAGQIIPGPGGDLWATDTSGTLWLIPTDTFVGGGTDDIPVAFTLPDSNAKWICVQQDGSFAITQTQSGGAIWLTPFQMVVPSLLVAEGDATFTKDDNGPTGPVITDQADGHTYRIISTAGVLSTQLVT